MNLKDLKNSNILATIFIDSLDNKETLQETLFSVSKQTHPVDLLVVNNLEGEALEELKGILENPTITVRQAVEGKMEEEVITSDGKINYVLQQTEISEFPKLFNNVFNIALKNGYEFCSVVERDDIVGLNWFKLVDDYKNENPDVDIFFPIIRNTTNGVFSNLMNEAPWAEGMAEEAGKIDLNLLSRFNCMLPLGAAFKVKSIEEHSEQLEDGEFYPFKQSMKLSHYYEFLMRMVYNDLKGMCISRIGYEYRIKTVTEFKEYSCKIPVNLTTIPADKGGYMPQEAQFWMDLAKKEYFFDEDRNKVFEPPVQPKSEPTTETEPTTQPNG